MQFQCVLPTLGLFLFLSSQEANPAHPAQDSLTWSVHVSPERTLPWVPIAVTVTAENRTAVEQPFRKFHAQGMGLKVWIESLGGNWSSFSRDAWGRPAIPLPSILKPGEARSAKFWLIRDDADSKKARLARRRGGPETYLLREAGRYLVYAAVDVDWVMGKEDYPRFKGLKTLLPPVEIEVSEPEGQDLEAGRRFAEGAGPWSSDAMIWGGGRSGEVDVLEELVENHGDTVYGKYAAY